MDSHVHQITTMQMLKNFRVRRDHVAPATQLTTIVGYVDSLAAGSWARAHLAYAAFEIKLVVIQWFAL